MKRPILSLCFTCLYALTLHAEAVNPNPKSLEISGSELAKTRELVRKLASPVFHERESATRELDKLGRVALPAIQEGLKEANPEVQMRCEMLIVRATEDDIKARIACFLADTEMKFEHHLPGAREFFSVTGRSDAAKNLFRDIVLSPNRSILTAMNDKNELQKQVLARRGEFARNAGAGVVIINGTVQGSPLMSVTDLAAILLGECFLSDTGRRISTFPHILSQAALKTALEDSRLKEAFSSILAKWMDTREDPYNMYMALNAARTQKQIHAMPLAFRLLESKGAAISYRGQAMTYIAQFGGREHIDKLLPLLKDDSVLTTMALGGGGGANNRMTIQVRDAALSCLLHITKQKHEDYGFSNRYKGNVSDALKYYYYTYYFEGSDKDNKKREEAIRKWNEWYAANKDKKFEEKKD